MPGNMAIQIEEQTQQNIRQYTDSHSDHQAAANFSGNGTHLLRIWRKKWRHVRHVASGREEERSMHLNASTVRFWIENLNTRNEAIAGRDPARTLIDQHEP